MTDMSDFFTREKANSGIKLPLTLPTGEKTEHYLQIRGVDSDEFRAAEAAHIRQAVDFAQIEDVMERARKIDEAKTELIASLVVSWSFPMECNLENVVQFFNDAPQIMESVNKIAGKRKLFFALESAASRIISQGNSDSTKDQKAQV